MRTIINHLPDWNSLQLSRLLRDRSAVLVLIKKELYALEIPKVNHDSEVVQCVLV